MALNPKTVDDLHQALKSLLELWMRIKLVLTKAFGSGAITPEHESVYLNLKSDISRQYRAIAARLPSGLQFEGDKMMEMLKNAITMENLHGRPPNDKQGMYVLWHQIYIMMTRTLGALETMREGYYPHLHRARFKSVAPANTGKK